MFSWALRANNTPQERKLSVEHVHLVSPDSSKVLILEPAAEDMSLFPELLFLGSQAVDVRNAHA